MFINVLTIVGLLMMLFIGVVVGMRFWRRHTDRRAEQMDFNFGIDELHRLRSEGKLSDEEFERAKSIILIRRAGRADEPGTKRGFEVLRPPDSADRPPQ